MQVRLADIAAHAGVSEATVSRVLNGKPGVTADKRQLVLTALDVLGYERPSRLRRRSAGLVGLIVPELTNPIFPAFAQVIEAELAQRGYTPVLCTEAPGGATEDDFIEQLLERGVSGMVFVSGLHADTAADHERYRRLIERRLPVVFINGHVPDLEAPFISDDDVAAMELAVGHLVSLGHRAIGLAVGPERFVPVIRKVDGFRAAMRARLSLSEPEIDCLVEHSMFSVEGGQAAAARLLDREATAIVCGSDMMALGAVRAARQRGLAVPDDVSVVGYDDSPLIAFTDPPLTTVRQSVPAMGSAAVRALLDEIGHLPTPHAEYVFRPELIVRGSTGAAPDQKLTMVGDRTVTGRV